MELQQELINMSMLVPYAAQIIPRTRRTGAASSIYCYERGSEIQLNQQAAATTVYALIEVLDGNNEQCDVVNELITSQLDHLFGIPGSQQQPYSFEEAISHINTALQQSIPVALNAVIAYLHDDQIAVVHTGKAEAHMNRGRSFIRITEAIPQTVSGKSQAAFSEVADGTVKSGDKILLATPGLLHHIGIDQIKNSIMDNRPAASATKLARFVDNRPDSYRTAAVIIEITAPEYLAEFGGDLSTTVIDIGTKESFSQVAKATAIPAIRKTGRQIILLATRFGHWTVNVAFPATKKAATRSVNGIKSTYKKLRTR